MVIVVAVMFYWNAKLALLALAPLPLLVAGALAYTLGSDAWQLAAGRRRRPVSGREVLRELMPFLVAGFAAPGAEAAVASKGAA